NTDTGSWTKSPLASSCSNSTISSTKLSTAEALAYRGERGGGIGGDRKDRVEAAHREHLVDIGAEAVQRQLAALLLHLLRDHQQNPQTGATDIGEAGHIDRQARRHTAQRHQQPLFRRGGGAAVE